MEHTDIRCAQTCAGVCAALTTSLVQEREAILHYGDLRDQCTYPEVKIMLNQLILERKKTIELIEATTESIRARFGALHDVQESFEE
jgi:hypothetical protein